MLGPWLRAPQGGGGAAACHLPRGRGEVACGDADGATAGAPAAGEVGFAHPSTNSEARHHREPQPPPCNYLPGGIPSQVRHVPVPRGNKWPLYGADHGSSKLLLECRRFLIVDDNGSGSEFDDDFGGYDTKSTGDW